MQETPRYWRDRKFRYGLVVFVGPDGGVVGNVPTGIRDFVESKQLGQASEKLALQVISVVGNTASE